jgi:hypothetical protein
MMNHLDESPHPRHDGGPAAVGCVSYVTAGGEIHDGGPDDIIVGRARSLVRSDDEWLATSFHNTVVAG